MFSNLVAQRADVGLPAFVIPQIFLKCEKVDLHIGVLAIELLGHSRSSGVGVQNRIRDILFRQRVFGDRALECKKQEYAATGSAGRSFFHAAEEREQSPMLPYQLRKRIFSESRSCRAPELRP